MKKYKHPGLINSSQGLFFIAFAVPVSYVLSQPFENYNRSIAWLIIFLGAVLFYFMWKLLKQFENLNYLMALLIILILFPTFLGIILNQTVGSLGEGIAPIFYGSRRIKEVVLVHLYPSVLIQYGMLTLLTAGFLSGVAEKVYETFVKKLLPKSIAKKFYKLDRSLDKSSVKTSDNLFLISNKGILLGLIALLIHSLILILMLEH